MDEETRKPIEGLKVVDPTECVGVKRSWDSVVRTKYGEIIGISIASAILLSLIIAYFAVRFRINADFIKDPKTGQMIPKHEIPVPVVVKGKSKSGKSSSKVVHATLPPPSNQSLISQFYENLFVKFESFFGSTLAQFSIGVVVAIAMSNVISTFSSLIISPLVQVTIPDQSVFMTGVNLGRNVWMYPGQFLLSLIGFVLTATLIFFLTLFFTYVRQIPHSDTIGKGIVGLAVVSVFIAIIVYNAIDLVDTIKKEHEIIDDNPECSHVLKTDMQTVIPSVLPTSLATLAPTDQE